MENSALTAWPVLIKSGDPGDDAGDDVAGGLLVLLTVFVGAVPALLLPVWCTVPPPPADAVEAAVRVAVAVDVVVALRFVLAITESVEAFSSFSMVVPSLLLPLPV